MKRGLVLSGGGSKGAYESGVISYLLGEERIKYDVISGTSVGALNGAVLAMFGHGNEKIAADFLKEVWFDIDDGTVRKEWFPLIGKVFSLWKSSIYNTSPLRHFVESIIDIGEIRGSRKQLRIGAVSLQTGLYRVFTEESPFLIDAILASSAFPAAFEPVEIEEELWVDGGVREITPLQAAIDLGCDAIDIIITSPDHMSLSFDKSPKTINVALRSLDIMSDQISADDVSKAVLYNKLIDSGFVTKKRKIQIRIIRPNSMLNENPLRFNNQEIVSMHKAGYEDAERISELFDRKSLFK